MHYNKKVILRNGLVLTLRHGTAEDGKAVLDSFNLAHSETDFLLTYPDENSFTEQQEADFLAAKAESPAEAEIVAEIDGRIVGTAGIDSLGNKYKIRHRADFGISVEQKYNGMGIGRALTEACIECAKKAGYTQLELQVVADNYKAVSLYRSIGFTEFGRNPGGFKSKTSGMQELIYMKLDL